MDIAAERRLLTGEARIRSQISLCEICGGKVLLEVGSSPST